MSNKMQECVHHVQQQNALLMCSCKAFVGLGFKNPFTSMSATMSACLQALKRLQLFFHFFVFDGTFHLVLRPFLFISKTLGSNQFQFFEKSQSGFNAKFHSIFITHNTTIFIFKFFLGVILVFTSSAYSSRYRLCNINYVQPIKCNNLPKM